MAMSCSKGVHTAVVALLSTILKLSLTRSTTVAEFPARNLVSGRYTLLRKPPCFITAPVLSTQTARPQKAQALLVSSSTSIQVKDLGLRMMSYNDRPSSSLDHLHERMSDFITSCEASSACRLSIAVAGGGGHFLSTLASTPGASKVLIQGTITYDRESYREFIMRDYDPEKFKYSSPESSLYLAEATLKQALKSSAAGDPTYGHVPIQNMTKSIGLACASSLRSVNDREGKVGKAFITARMAHGDRTVQCHVVMAGAGESRRSRLEEDIFASHCMLTCLRYALTDYSVLVEQKKDYILESTGGPLGERILTWTEATQEGDEIRMTVPFPSRDVRETLCAAASLVLSGQRGCVLLLPTQDGTNFHIIPNSVIPPDSLIFPGSFHPPHKGHVELAKAGMTVARCCKSVIFELSLTNADKPSLEAEDVANRVQKFLTLSDMPEEWGVLLTNAPLFKEKVELLHPLQARRSFEKVTPLHFCIGTDTLIRLLSPKYYNDSVDAMIAALIVMPCEFVVGSRVEQKVQNQEPQLITGEEQVKQLPEALRSKFSLMTDFRVDISSTEIRNRLSSSDGVAI